jgi:hypothetical protein
LRNDIIKQPLTLIIKIESGAHGDIGAIHSDIAKRRRLPIPPPIATKKYLLMETI